MMMPLLGILDPLELFKALNGLSPLAVIGLLGYIIYMLVAKKKSDEKLTETVVSVKDNHLHDLPEVVELVRSLNTSMIRMENTLQAINNTCIYIRARLNGHAKED